MADAVTSQVILNGTRNLVIKFTNISDGTGESAVTKVAAATYGTGLKILKLHYSTFGMAVRVLWDATADVPAFLIPQDADGTFDFTGFGGLTNDGGTGVTGNIQFTTIGAASGDTYTIIMEMAKA